MKATQVETSMSFEITRSSIKASAKSRYAVNVVAALIIAAMFIAYLPT